MVCCEGGGIWGTLEAVLHGQAEWFVQVVLQGSVPMLLVFNMRTRIIRAFEYDMDAIATACLPFNIW